jgi:hypothetical protein
MGVGDADNCPSIAMRAGSRVVGCPGLVVAWRKRRWSSFLSNFGIFHSISTNQHRGERGVYKPGQLLGFEAPLLCRHCPLIDLGYVI